MRILRVLPLIFAIAVIWLLNHPMGALPAIGKVMDPINGALAAAEPADEDFNQTLHLKDLRAPVTVWLEDRLVPHIRAGNDHDLYYTQGYIHAYFRLWQMDIQTRAAGGRVSEVAGKQAIEFDRGQRRKGMVWAAQHSLAAMEAEPRTKAMLDAYRDGINAYIHTLNFRSLPIEYKLMGFYPEDWTNIRTALLMKYMADDLTGKTDDIAFTILRDQLGQEQFDFLFPERIKGSKPVIPEGTKFAPPSMAQPEVPGDSVWAHFGTDGKSGVLKPETVDKQSGNAVCVEKNGVFFEKNAEKHVANGKLFYARGDDVVANANLYDKNGDFVVANGNLYNTNGILYHASGDVVYANGDLHNASGDVVEKKADFLNNFPTGHEEEAIGSNNWAISGSHTASGKPILCNDPHLGLNLPSLWFEMQLSAPGINVYGASLPGAPGIVIGFNDKISWGFTNNYRDVKDFYEITPAENGAYLFCGKSVPFQHSIEIIKVKGGPDVTDTVLYTLHGPVNYDPSFPDPVNSGKLLACTWMAHRGTNELLAVYLLNRAGDYTAFTDAIRHFECPAQNFAYADVAGNIAMWGQGRFINKWKGQGRFVMEGRDSATLWGRDILMAENPHVLNPPQGYVASANQQVTDSTYPYWYDGSFVEWRSWEINKAIYDLLNGKAVDAITCAQMQELQLSTFSWLQMKTALTFKNNSTVKGTEFNYFLNPESTDATVYQLWWTRLYKDIWQDDFPNATKWPSSERTVQLLLSDSTSKYYDDKRTLQIESLRNIVQRAFRETEDSLKRLLPRGEVGPGDEPSPMGNLRQWYLVKNTTLTHLAKIPAFSYDHLKIGGWSNTINAVSGNHGPSWRMIVEMDSIPKAYAVYPGGQSGKPGSPHYSDYIQHWVAGKYFTIQFLTAATIKNPFRYTWTLTP